MKWGDHELGNLSVNLIHRWVKLPCSVVNIGGVLRGDEALRGKKQISCGKIVWRFWNTTRNKLFLATANGRCETVSGRVVVRSHHACRIPERISVRHTGRPISMQTVVPQTQAGSTYAIVLLQSVCLTKKTIQLPVLPLHRLFRTSYQLHNKFRSSPLSNCLI